MKVVLRVGQRVDLTAPNFWRAVDAAAGRHRVDASDTRGAGTDFEMHVKGTMAEAVGLQACGIVRGPKVLATVDHNADIPEATPNIEMKFRTPVEARTKVNPRAAYVVVDALGSWVFVNEMGWKEWARSYSVTRIALGKDILDAHVVPDPKMCPRAGTEKLNWVIPESLQEIEVEV